MDNADPVRRLVEEHLPLARQVLTEVTGRLPRLADPGRLGQAAAGALVTAAVRYAGNRDVAFGSWASPRIRAAVLSALAETSGSTAAPDVPVSLSAAQWQPLVAMAEQALAAADPKPTRVDALVPLERPGSGLRAAVAELPEPLREILQGYYFAGRRVADLAGDLGVPPAEVERLRDEALARLAGVARPERSRADRGVRPDRRLTAYPARPAPPWAPPARRTGDSTPG